MIYHLEFSIQEGFIYVPTRVLHQEMLSVFGGSEGGAAWVLLSAATSSLLFPGSSTPTVSWLFISVSFPFSPQLSAKSPHSWFSSTILCAELLEYIKSQTYRRPPQSLWMEYLWCRTRGPLITMFQISVSFGKSDLVDWRTQKSVSSKYL